jgi:cell division protein FtsA
VPVYRPEQPEVSGIHEYFRDPQYSTVVGLIRYAQLMDEDRPRDKSGVFGKLIKAVWPF